MRLRLALTVSFERARSEARTEEAPQVDEKGAAILERAEPASVGFVIPGHPSDPSEERRR